MKVKAIFATVFISCLLAGAALIHTITSSSADNLEGSVAFSSLIEAVRANGVALDSLQSQREMNNSNVSTLDVTTDFLQIYDFEGDYSKLFLELRRDGFKVWAGSNFEGLIQSGKPSGRWFMSMYHNMNSYLEEKTYPIKVWVLLGNFPNSQESVEKVEAVISIMPDGI